MPTFLPTQSPSLAPTDEPSFTTSMTTTQTTTLTTTDFVGGFVCRPAGSSYHLLAVSTGSSCSAQVSKLLAVMGTCSESGAVETQFDCSDVMGLRGVVTAVGVSPPTNGKGAFDTQCSRAAATLSTAVMEFRGPRGRVKNTTRPALDCFLNMLGVASRQCTAIAQEINAMIEAYDRGLFVSCAVTTVTTTETTTAFTIASTITSVATSTHLTSSKLISQTMPLSRTSAFEMSSSPITTTTAVSRTSMTTNASAGSASRDHGLKFPFNSSPVYRVLVVIEPAIKLKLVPLFLDLLTESLASAGPGLSDLKATAFGEQIIELTTANASIADIVKTTLRSSSGFFIQVAGTDHGIGLLGDLYTGLKVPALGCHGPMIGVLRFPDVSFDSTLDTSFQNEFEAAVLKRTMMTLDMYGLQLHCAVSFCTSVTGNLLGDCFWLERRWFTLS